METQTLSILLCLFFIILVINSSNLRVEAQTCTSSGTLTGTKPPRGACSADCCVAGKKYPTYKCSPKLLSNGTKAILTLNSFQEGGDGGAESACDEKFHSDNELIVALSTGWYNGSKRCLKYITVYGNGKSVKAKVVDECDSTLGCDYDHGYQPPCRNNIVDGSKAVWKALGVPQSQWGELDVYWKDA